ncbi:hypothetical protein D3C87_1573290 [compost metagenome]
MPPLPPGLLVAPPVPRHVGRRLEHIAVDVLETEQIGAAQQPDEEILHHFLGVGRRSRPAQEEVKQWAAKPSRQPSEPLFGCGARREEARAD